MRTSSCRLLKMESDEIVDDFFGSLPEGFVAKALSLTSPQDACRLSLVCSVFRSAAQWDAVWEAFLPADWQNIVKDHDDENSLCTFHTKKELFLRLCDRPLIFDGGNKGFTWFESVWRWVQTPWISEPKERKP
ncbi:putative F-box protein PP2-B12 [Tanacetum coccineum]